MLYATSMPSAVLSLIGTLYAICNIYAYLVAKKVRKKLEKKHLIN
jgi:hypothetical protein